MAHVWVVHPNAISSSLPQPQCTLSCIGIRLHRPCSNSRQEQITGLISDILVANMLSVSLVESPEFSVLLVFLEPAYKPACRQMMMPFDNQCKNWFVLTGGWLWKNLVLTSPLEVTPYFKSM